MEGKSDMADLPSFPRAQASASPSRSELLVSNSKPKQSWHDPGIGPSEKKGWLYDGAGDDIEDQD